MRAAWYEDYGPAEEVFIVGELPDPAPGPGEVRVRLHASGINPSDCNRRAGIRDRPSYARIIPHSDGAGVIDAVGDGIDPGRVGERVWVYNGQRGRAFGTAAEYIALASEQAVRLPDETSFAAGACLGIPAMTSYQSLFADGPVEGLDVLVTGAAGACGHYAVQFAKLAGARRVIATVSTPEKAAHAAKAGADVVVNYRDEDVAARVLEATDGEGIDRISEVDFGGNLAVALKVLKVGGVIGAYASKGDPEPRLPFYPLMFRDATIRLLQVFRMPRGLRAQALADVTRWCAGGMLEHAIGRTQPLDRIAEAHRLVDTGAVMGNVVLEI